MRGWVHLLSGSAAALSSDFTPAGVCLRVLSPVNEPMNEQVKSRQPRMSYARMCRTDTAKTHVSTLGGSDLAVTSPPPNSHCCHHQLLQTEGVWVRVKVREGVRSAGQGGYRG